MKPSLTIKQSLIIGFVLIAILATVVFSRLISYMDNESEKDIRQISASYIEGVANGEVANYKSIAEIRHNQIEYLKNRLDALGPNATARQIEETAAEAASFQDLASCAFISESGQLITVYGEELATIGNPEYLHQTLIKNASVVMGGNSTSGSHFIVWAVPARYPLSNGEKSLGILYCRPMDQFVEKMNLEAEGTLATFLLIRRDGSYPVEGSETEGDTYYEKILRYAHPIDSTAEEEVEKLKTAIGNNEVWGMDIRYINEQRGINEHRTIRAEPLPESNWYLVTLLPYGALDVAIARMGSSRMFATILSVVILSIGILLVFLFYMRASEKQRHALELANEEAANANAELSIAQAKTEEALTEAEAANQDLIEAREKLEDALTEAEAANQDLIAAREEAEEAREDAVAANKAKSEFLSNMSHDIRTPMNAIVGMTAIATEHMDDKDRVRDCLRKITLAGKQLLGLINDVLDMSKIESGKMTLNLEPLSLRQTMETMCDIVRPQIKSNGQNFDIFISNILAENVYCDSIRLNQVLLNFLSNAMKFTPEGGKIYIGLRQEPSPKGDNFVRSHISVTDTGMGMTDEFKKKLFTAFEREDNRRVHKTQGTGLGLTITKYIVDAMGGTIDVDSKPGEGTSFHITVDFEKVKESQAKMKLPGWRILIVDDNKDICETAELSLRELGALPQSCTSGARAIQMVTDAHEKGEDFFAVLIDYRMDGMNGVETALNIRKASGGAEIPISLISAYDWGDIEEDAKRADITGFIPKPLFKSTLYHGLIQFDKSADAAESLYPEEQEVDLTGTHILLAEDNDINAEIATMILEESGARIDWAEDGKIATEMFASSEEGTYQVILMDLRMPHMNGFEATEAIRSMKRADAVTVPIIAMTADAFAEDAQKCLAAGMNAHLAKPIDINALKKTLAKYLYGA